MMKSRQTMHSPCLTEVSEVFSNVCCSSPLSSSSNQMVIAPRSSTSEESRREFVAKTSSLIFPRTQFTNHESIPSLQESYSVFIDVYPNYHKTRRVDKIRAKEYSNLSTPNLICLDYTGIGLFAYSQLLEHEDSSISIHDHLPFPSRNLSFPFFTISNKTGDLKTQLLYEGHESDLEFGMKERVFRFLNISENDYSIVFTANRTSAFKLLAESYPFKTSSKLLTVYDYESEAIEAMINSSEKRGAKAMSAEFSWPRLRIRSAKLREMIVSKNRKKKSKRGLFVFPMNSRVSGARYPYMWMSIAQENRWHILIDACSLGPKDMNSFGLSIIQPDFLVCSFYKIFGENPSGFGCLIVKKSTIQALESSSSAGIVNIVKPQKLIRFAGESSNMEIEPEKSTEVHTVNYKLASASSFSGPLSFQASKHGNSEERSPKGFETLKFKEEQNSENEIECKYLDQVDSVGLVSTALRSRCLINWLVSSMTKLKHPNEDGDSLIRIYGPKIKFDRGPALAFNVFDWKGEKVDPVLVQKLADRNNISLSYGFLHHIWFSDKHSGAKGRFLERRTRGGNEHEMEKKKSNSATGITVVTVALGFLTNFEDVYKLWAFMARFLDADFVEKERWRYTALNQKIIEV